LAVGVAMAMIANHNPVLLPIACTLWSIAGYHAYRTTPLSYSNPSRSSKMLMVVVLGSLLLRLGIGSLPLWVDQAVLQCIVPSESMLPTLQVNDSIFVSRGGTYYPENNDIVVFRAPPKALEILEAEPETLFVKRIVGLPGQQVSIRDGQLWINRVPVDEGFLKMPPRYQWGPELVPPESYFVLGDNRNESADSHVWGFLPKDYIIGEAYKIYWPPERVRSLQH